MLVPTLLLALAAGPATNPQDGAAPGTAAPPDARPELSPEAREQALTLSPLPPPPADPTNRVADDPRAARLGQYLFYDTRFSRNGAIGCATCHVPETGWTDERRRGKGLQEVARNVMSLWNVAYNRWYFWDGRADSLWSQALQPIENPREEGTSRLFALHAVAADADLARAYEEVFGPLPPLEDEGRFPADARPVPDDPDDPQAVAWASMTADDQELADRAFTNLGKAIEAFERRIVSQPAPFDRYVEGLRDGDPAKLAALSDEAVRGLELFVGKARCILCHNGPLLSDREFHVTRVPPLEGGGMTDPGRFKGIELVQGDPFNGTGAFSDAPEGESHVKVDYLYRSGHNWAEFKTPSLRNVTLTAPYMHEGQMDTLRQVMSFYSSLKDAVPTKHRIETLLVPANLVGHESEDLIAFLGSLTNATIDPALLSQPATPWLPPAGGDPAEESGAHGD